jgi:hypothetical protein
MDVRFFPFDQVSKYIIFLKAYKDGFKLLFSSKTVQYRFPHGRTQQILLALTKTTLWRQNFTWKTLSGYSAVPVLQ